MALVEVEGATTSLEAPHDLPLARAPVGGVVDWHAQATCSTATTPRTVFQIYRDFYFIFGMVSDSGIKVVFDSLILLPHMIDC